MFKKLISISPVFYMIVSALCAFAGDYFAKSFSDNHRVSFLIVTMICYQLGSFTFIMTLFQGKFTIMNVLRNVLSIGLGLIMGLLIFREHITFLQAIGIVCCTIGVILMSIEE